MDQGSDRPGGDGHVFALRDEQAYLQTDDDDKPAIIAEPPPYPAQFKCWFCRKSYQRVQTFFGAEYPVRDPNTFAAITPIFICDECVARFAQSLPKSPEPLP